MARNENENAGARAGELAPIIGDDIFLDATQLSPRQVMALEKVTAKNLERLVEEAESLVKFTNRIKTVALKATNGGDWAVFGDKPYLLESGVKSVLQIVGSSIFDTSIDEEIRVEESGKKVGYFTAIGKILFNGRVYTNIGTANTKDKFFAQRGEHEDGSKKILNYDEVDIQNCRKKAVTNLQHRLLDMALKLRPTLEELKALGIEPKGKVEFAGGSQGGKVDTKEEGDLRLTLKTALARASALTGKAIGEILTGVTAFDDFRGYSSPDKVSPKMLKRALTSVEKIIKETEAKQGGAGAPAAGAVDTKK